MSRPAGIVGDTGGNEPTEATSTNNHSSGKADDITTASGIAADYTAISPRVTRDGGITYDLLESGRLYRVSCPIPGGFTVSNTLGRHSGGKAVQNSPRDYCLGTQRLPADPGQDGTASARRTRL